MLSMWVDLSRVIYSFDCKSLTPLWSQNWGFEGNCYTTKVWTWFGFWLAYMCETTWVTLNRKRENLLWTLMLQRKTANVLVGSSLPHFKCTLPGVTPLPNPVLFKHTARSEPGSASTWMRTPYLQWSRVTKLEGPAGVGGLSESLICANHSKHSRIKIHEMNIRNNGKYQRHSIMNSKKSTFWHIIKQVFTNDIAFNFSKQSEGSCPNIRCSTPNSRIEQSLRSHGWWWWLSSWSLIIHVSTYGQVENCWWSCWATCWTTRVSQVL